MKQKKSSFKVRPFKNPSGQTVYQVDGFINGKCIRQNFPTRKEALLEKEALELKAVQSAASNLRMVGTHLSDDELRQAESVFLRIRGDSRTLIKLVDFGLANLKESKTEKLLAEAITEYVAHRTADHKRGLISDAQILTIRKQTVLLQESFKNVMVSDLTAEKITAYCSREGAALKTHNNRRGIVSTFLKYAEDNGWIAQNPISKVPHYDITHKRGSAATLTAEKAAALMNYVENYRDGCLAPFFALALFAGIRPDNSNGEISKLTAGNVNMNTGVIHVEPEISKVDMKRNVTIQPNLAAWLAAYPLTKYPLVVKNMWYHRIAISKKFGLSHDVLRHTFISMHVAKFRSMGDTALQAGNSEAIIRRHYLDVKSSDEANAFFSIMPKKAPEESAAATVVAGAAEVSQLAA